MNSKRIVYTAAIVFFLVGSILGGTILGSSGLSVDTVLAVLKMKLLDIDNINLPSSTVYIIWNLRLPRAILAIAAGGGLAVCGVSMQAITQNVLADPYVLGVSSGASAMVSFAFFLGGVFFASGIVVQTFAFLGAIIAMFLVYYVGAIKGRTSNSRLVLAGMAVSIILNATSQFFITMSNEKVTRSITMWMMGSLAEARWNNVIFPLIASLIGFFFFFVNAGAYDLISLGDETAISMGINATKIRKCTMLMVAFVTGAIVSCCGIIGLVGFVIPHIVRFLFGSGHRGVIPISYLVGCIFLVWMDVIARLVLAPQEIPIGIFTAFCGGPFFVWLLYQHNRTIAK